VDGDRWLSYSRVPLGHLLAELEAGGGGGLGRLMDGVSGLPTGRTTGLDGPGVRAAIASGVPPADVLQGLLEDAAGILARYADAWVAAGGTVDRVVAVGGGAAHAGVLQLKANVLGRPVSALTSDEASSLGALRLAAVAVEGAPPAEACRRFPNPVARTWVPSL
jgi:xylulokinase